MKKDRIIGLDLIRALAILLVVVTHMFNYTGILAMDIHSLNWAVSDVMHYVSMMCVPLFLLLTGYLQRNRKPDKKHYVSILPLVITYIVMQMINGLLEIRLFGMPAFPEGAGLWQLLLHIFDYSYGYAWYMEMYICLFMLIPFINILFHALDQKKQRVLIAVMMGVTMIPALVRGFRISGVELNIFPDFLENMYVVTYYLLGAYIAEHKPQPKKWLCGAVLFGVLFFESVCCWAYTNPDYAWYLFNHNATLTHAIASVCLFLLLYQVDFKCRPLRFVITEISVCSFEMYLISYFTDKYVYAHFWQLPVWGTVAMSFAAAYVVARAVNTVKKIIVKR